MNAYFWQRRPWADGGSFWCAPCHGPQPGAPLPGLRTALLAGRFFPLGGEVRLLEPPQSTGGVSERGLAPPPARRTCVVGRGHVSRWTNLDDAWHSKLFTSRDIGHLLIYSQHSFRDLYKYTRCYGVTHTKRCLTARCRGSQACSQRRWASARRSRRSQSRSCTRAPRASSRPPSSCSWARCRPRPRSSWRRRP